MQTIENKRATQPAKATSLAVSRTQATAPTADVNLEVVRLRHENELLREALSSLAFKIKAECAKGTRPP